MLRVICSQQSLSRTPVFLSRCGVGFWILQAKIFFWVCVTLPLLTVFFDLVITMYYKAWLIYLENRRNTLCLWVTLITASGNHRCSNRGIEEFH